MQDNEENAYNLAITGAIKDEILYQPDVAVQLIKRLQSLGKEKILNSKYGVDTDNNIQEIEILKLIGKKRGCLIKGGEIDIERSAKMLITDFRSGKLGKICLEII